MPISARRAAALACTGTSQHQASAIQLPSFYCESGAGWFGPDCPDSFGYCDFAIGSFGIETPLKEGAREAICADWDNQESNGQQRWAYLFKTGLISKEDADAWAEEVWPSKQDGAEVEGDVAMKGEA